MSYDVDIGGEWFNYTSNLAPLFYDHIPPQSEECRGGIHALDGKTGKQAALIIANFFGAVDNTIMQLWREGDGSKQFCARYDAANGWGSAISAIVWLGKLQAVCIANPRKKVRASA